MPDFRVRFVGDLGNLHQFDAAIRNAMGENARQLQAANLSIASQIDKVAGIYDKKRANIIGPNTLPAGLYVDNAKSTVDAFNRTIVHSGELVRRTLSGYATVLDKESGKHKLQPIFTDEYYAAFTKARGDLDAYNIAIEKTAGTEEKLAAVREAAGLRQIQLLDLIDEKQKAVAGHQGALQAKVKGTGPNNGGAYIDPVTGSIPYLDLLEQEKRLEGLRAGTIARTPPRIGHSDAVSGPVLNYPEGKYIDLNHLDNKITQLNSEIQNLLHPPSRDFAPQRDDSPEVVRRRESIKYLEQVKTDATLNAGLGVTETEQDIRRTQDILDKATASERAVIASIENEINTLKARNERIPEQLEQRLKVLRAGDPAYAEAEAARNAPPPINKNLASALNESKQLRQELLSGGLGGGARYGTEQFKKNLAEQEAAVSRFSNNMRTGVRTITGSFRNLKTGILEDFTVDLDKNGKVIGRWGGQLSGAGAILKQTVRDFQKVIEWTLATTAVFGTLAFAVKSLESINNLNESLTRFSITAQLTSQETNELFLRLGDVAIATATPLQDLVKVADDIALATKRAGDSTDQWQQKIIDLTQAVGIFTNLTGESTVEAADKLSSVFKQLQINPDQLTGVLSKVSAVAGGQSTAINEIVTALGGVAEAGKAAGLSLDEQIATVQVLSQVTNKSAADVATAFKNLFGSVYSVGSEKILSKFGIQIRDATTNDLIPFLEIYHQINEALAKGIIPPGQFADVLRGISGGPRRSPDAAALLGNLGLIDAAKDKAAGATNEALVANAKILDTNKAKIVQLQNAFDIALFERFGKAVSQVTDSVTGFLTAITKAFNAIPTPLLTLGIQLLGIVAIGKVLSSTFKIAFGVIGGSISGSIRSMKDASLALGNIINQETNFMKLQNLGTTRYGPGGLFTKGGQRVERSAQGEVTSFASGYSRRDGSSIQIPANKAGNVPGVYKFDPFYVPLSDRLAKSLTSFKGVGKLALGAGAVAGGAALLSNAGKNGIDKSTVATVLQLAGSISLATGVLAPLGVAALVAGTALSVLGNESNNAVKSQDDLRNEAFSLTQALKEAQDNASTFAKAQKESGEVIDRLRKKTELTKEEQAQLASQTDIYVQSTLSLADANNTVSKTFDELLLKIPQLKDHYSAFVESVKSGALTPDSPAVQSLRAQLIQDILSNTGQQIYSGPDLKPTSDFHFANSSGSTIAQQVTNVTSQGTSGITVPTGQEIDLSKLLENPSALKDLFKDSGEGPYGTRYEIPQSDQNLGYLITALSQLPELIKSGKTDVTLDEYDKIAAAIGALAAKTSTTALNQAVIQQNKAGLQADVALGLRTQDQASNASLAVSLQELVQKSLISQPKPSIGPSGAPYNASPQVQILQGQFAQLDAAAKAGLEIPNALLVHIGEEALKATKTTSALGNAYDDLKSKGEQALEKGIIEELVSAGLSTEKADALAKAYGLTLKDIGSIADELKIKLDAGLNTAASNYSDRALQLTIEKANGGGADVDALIAQNEAAFQSAQDLVTSISNVSALGYSQFADAISGVVGLTQLSTTSTEDLAEQQSELGNVLIENAVKANVNAAGIIKIKDEYAKLLTLTTGADTLKSTSADVTQKKAAGAGQLGLNDFGKELQTQLNEATRGAPALDAQRLSEIQKIIDTINSIFAAPKNQQIKTDSLFETASNYADRALQLQVQKNSGGFEKNAKGYSVLVSQNEAARKASDSLNTSISKLSGATLDTFADGLSNVTGLTQLSTLSMEQLAEQQGNFGTTLIENAVKAGVNAEGISQITQKVNEMNAALQILPTYKKILIEVTTQLNPLETNPVGTTYSRGAIAGIQQAQDLKTKAEKAQADAIKKGTDPSVILKNLAAQINKILGTGKGSELGQLPKKGPEPKKAKEPDVSEIDIPKEIADASNRSALIQEAVRRARALQTTIPGAVKEGSDDIVSLLKGTQNILQVRGVKDDLLRRALEELADIEKKRLEQETKADTIRRIRVGAGDFSSIANVPLNSQSGISFGGAQGPINITLNMNGTVLTPAQFGQFSRQIAADLKKQLTGN